MPAISARVDMNSSGVCRRSHKDRIGPRVDFDEWSAERAGEQAERAIGRHLVPMVEIVIEKPLLPNTGDPGAEKRGHPEQRHQALIQSDAAEAGEGDQDEQADS